MAQTGSQTGAWVPSVRMKNDRLRVSLYPVHPGGYFRTMEPDGAAMADPKRDWIVKSNDFVTARYDWSALQQRMVLMMIAQLDPFAEDFGTQTVRVADLKELSDLSSKAYYERVTDAARALLDQKIFVQTKEGNWRGYNLLSYAEAREGEGCVEARFNPDMRPFLLRLKQRFTRYVLQNVMRLQSPYSIRIYELLQQYADIGHRTISVAELRYLLILEDKYPRWYDFKRRVLEQARKEINELTNLRCRYTEIRKGRQVIAVRFYIQTRRAGAEAGAAEPVQQRLFPEMEKDAFDFYLSSLTEDEVRRLRERAEDRVPAKIGSGWVREMEIEKMMRTIWKENAMEAVVT